MALAVWQQDVAIAHGHMRQAAVHDAMRMFLRLGSCVQVGRLDRKSVV